jgi:hypothetical protein
MIKTAFRESEDTAASTRHCMRAVGAFIAATEFEQANGLPPGQIKSAKTRDTVNDRATCIVGARLFEAVGNDCLSMPVYHMIKSAGDGTISHEFLVKKCADSVRRGIAKVKLEEQPTTKQAKANVMAALPFLSRGAAMVPDTAKMLLGLGVGLGGLGGAGLYYANDATGKDNAKVEALKRQAEIYRRMREEIDQDAREGGLLNVDVT